MNNAEEISKYSDNNSHYRSPTLARRAGVELSESVREKPKKDKKWSLGGFFRRKKKEIESESSSEEEVPQKRGFLQRRKQRKEDKRKKRANKSLGHFDHIVVTPFQPGVVNGNKDLDEYGGILSEPTLGVPYNPTGSISRITSSNERISSRQDLNLSRGSLGSISQDSLSKKSRKDKVKARVEALRDRLKNDSSSDEGSQRSTASSITRFKSDDSLSKKESRKTRSARTERYNRRLTKEEEHVLNKEAELEKQKNKPVLEQTKVQVNRWVVVDDMPKSPPVKPYIKPILNYIPSTPLSQKSYPGVSTIPPSHNILHRTTSNLSDGPRNYFNSSHKPTMFNPSRIQMNPSKSIPRNYSNSYQEKPDFKPEQRSFSYDCNINRSPTPGNEEQILHVHFPIGKPIPKQRNPNLINNTQHMVRVTPPPPPPRDPQRRIVSNPQYENSRPMSYAFENGNHQRQIPIQQTVMDRGSTTRASFNHPSNISNINRTHSFGWHPNHRSSSEDHITQSNLYNQNPLTPRPASATPDAPQQRFIRRHPTTDQYKYFAEKTPRSRKPILISSTGSDQPYLSDSQISLRNCPGSRHPVHIASEFWKQKDAEEINRRMSQVLESHKDKKAVTKKSEEKDVKKNFAVLSIPVKTADSLSSLSGTSDTSPLNTKQFFEQSEGLVRPLSMVLEKAEAQESKIDPPDPPVRRYSRQSSASSTENNWINDPEDLEKRKKHSSNLEEALDELEAIYKSLRLGDEDLLDRAERRDVPPAVTQKLLTKMPESYVNWGPPGSQSDSGFNYDIDCIDGLRKKKNLRRSNIPDKLNDDMAYRRLNKDRPPPLDPNVAVSQVSYLLASPVLGAPPVDENDNDAVLSSNEPDITLDDVVYRNIKHTNNSLKVAEPQPLFGIPLGPITGASNSDYLHAIPENRARPRFIPQKSPDIVKDDLAYRSLRKDNPGLVPDDIINNNNPQTENSLKKRRAVRSISANIYNLMHKDTLRATESENEFDKAQSLTDIADAMEIARQVLRDRQNKLYNKTTNTDLENKLIKMNLNNSNTQTSTETLTDTFNQKPPICPTPDRKSSKPPTKESTPNRVSPAFDEEPIDNNHLADLLTALAIEARETSEKLGNDLKLLDEKESRKCSPRISQSSTPAPEEISKTIDEKLSDIDAVSEHAKLCEKLLGAVVESTKLISHSIPTNEDQEQVIDLDEPKLYTSVANIVVTRKADEPNSNPLQEQCNLDEHDYENLQNEDEQNCVSPFEDLKNDLFSDTDFKCETSKEDKADDLHNLQDVACSEEEHSNTSSDSTPDHYHLAGGSKLLERPVSCGNVPLALMSNQTAQELRAERVARYKDERRRQLAQQSAQRIARVSPMVNCAVNGPSAQTQQSLPSPRRYITRSKSTTPNPPNITAGTQNVVPHLDSSGSEGISVRTTRASRLRAAKLNGGGATSVENGAAGTNGRKNGVTAADKERSPLPLSPGVDAPCSIRVLRTEKDKSSKRKSNLNRSLNAEDTPSPDLHDDSLASRRRRRRVLNPNDILTSLNESGLSSGSTSTSARVTPLPSPSAASSNQGTTPRTPTSSVSPTTRKSELSIHMENARRGVTASSSTPKRIFTSSPRNKSDSEKKRSTNSEQEEYFSFSDKDCKTRKTPERKTCSSDEKNGKTKRFSGEFDKSGRGKAQNGSKGDVTKRIDDVTACTKETLARVERLTQRMVQNSRRDDSKLKVSKSPEKSKDPVDLDLQNHNGLHEETSKPSSILKKKSLEEPLVNPIPSSVHIHGPISILKRKSSQDEAGSSASPSSFNTPVTFSPTVVDRVSNRKKPGILKKRCSLDESHVIRRRSYSPDVALVEGSSDCRPILKNQRRSSLEELVRTRSPDFQPHGILKRKHSRGEDEFGERSLGSPEPQSILKRKSGTSSSGSCGNSPHVSIATAVILAAAGGAEIILESSELVKPILKKKSISEEYPLMDSLNPEGPKPILKKKSSTETDDQDDRPKKPILKTSRKCSQDESYSRDGPDYGIDSPRIYSMLRNRSSHNSGESSSECETTVRPILKQSNSRENSPRPRLSFCNNEEESKPILNKSLSPRPSDCLSNRSKFVRRSNTVSDADLSSIINLTNSSIESREKEKNDSSSGKEEQCPKRPISVFELVMNFEKTNGNSSSTGAIPKRSSLKGSRSSGRFRTQPITFDELVATQSLEPVQNFQPCSEAAVTSEIFSETQSSPHREQNSSGDLSHSLDLTCSTLSLSNNDSQLTTPSSMPNESADSGVASKMSFANDDEVSREEDVESPQELCRSNSVSAKASMFKQLEAQMKAVAEEAKAVRLGKSGNKGVQRYRNRKQVSASSSSSENRFSTQPVTLDEVQEAVRANQRAADDPEGENVPIAETSEEPDPSKLSLAERVKLFNQKITQERLPIAPGGGPAGGIVRKPRHTRFKTQPVTTEEVETAQAHRIGPIEGNRLEGVSNRSPKDKIFEHAAKMLTNEVKGILKSKSAISPIPTNSPSPENLKNTPQTILKQEETLLSTNGHRKTDSSEDEGVSTEDTTSSGSENLPQDHKTKKDRKLRERDSSNEKENKEDIEKINNKKNTMRLKVDECMKELEGKQKVRRHLEEVQQMSSSTEDTPQTSDGESSGGREVKRIISNDAVARRRQAAINRQKEKNGQLTKSKSQSFISRNVSRYSLPPKILLDPLSNSYNPADESPSSPTFLRGGVRRSLTLPLRASSSPAGDMPGGGTIADRLAELQQAGNNEWRKRLPKLNTANDELIELNNIVTKNLYNDSLSADAVSLEKTSILAARKDKLDAASQQWKKRVEASDAVNFSVAGRMQQEAKDLHCSPLTVAAQDKRKRTPKATRFRSKEETKPASSTPVSPQKEIQVRFKRSISAPGVGDEDVDSDPEPSATKTKGRRVIVPRPDDETFTTFFESVANTSQAEHFEVTEDDLDSVTRQSGGLLVTKRTVRVQRKHVGTAKNPIKALAARTDIKEEYTEVVTGIAEREKKRINIEKLAKYSSMAIEALAGLASTEDFTAISLKKNSTTSGSLPPYKDLMLLHIKGRRHVQTRLVAPQASSINKGDNYVLVTPTQVFNYVGAYSNIIEQSRGAEIAQHIQQKKDLGCKCNDVFVIYEDPTKNSKSQLDMFWKLLGATAGEEITEAGHPDEDEIYESAIVDTNMVYELDGKELIPVDTYWGQIPKIEMLASSKVFVFDFGGEMYIWSGRNVPIEQRREGAKLAKELWNEGFNYSDCAICPINTVELLGHRDIQTNPQPEKQANSRPDWGLISKITQHGETILFREKFLDWPDFSRVIKVKNNDSEKTVDCSITLKPCDSKQMQNNTLPLPDLVLGSHLSRGTNHYNETSKQDISIPTLGVQVWHVLEYKSEELPKESFGMFYNGDSYVIRWQYQYSVIGNSLSGKPAKHVIVGRDRCAYFCWQGKNAPVNDKGAAALLTVELDHERGPQVRVTQGAEPPAFLNLFKGLMTIHTGRRDALDGSKPTHRLYMCRGELENESHLLEVTCSMRQLRSRASFLLLNLISGSIIIWHGCKSLKHHRNNAVIIAKKIKDLHPPEFNFLDGSSISITETEEGDECEEFFGAFTGGNRQLYFSLLKNPHNYTHTPRMFHLSSVSGLFEANEVSCPHRSDQTTSYPFIQSDLYSENQPALFMIDNGHELWLWQGWWPEVDSDSDSDSERLHSDQTGSGQHRWQAERRAAMQTTLDYWMGPTERTVPAYLVWAGLEPLEFTNLFPTWTDRDDIAELNIRDGRKPGEILKVEIELARLTQSTYPITQLLQRPLPDGVDPTHLEDYLSGEDFISLLGMAKPDFQKLPTWKQTNIKKEKGLF